MEHPKAEERLAPVRKSVEIHRPVADAFRLFVEEIHSWWPLASYSISREKARHCVFEGRVGGQIYEDDNDGERHLWGMVRVWEPPHRVLFSWHPGRNSETAQEVELRFTPSGHGTRVDLEHRDWEVLGADAEPTRKSYEKGWEEVLGLYLATSEGGAA